MTLSLVSEARPLPEERLSAFEKSLLTEADDWLKAVIEDVKIQTKLTPDELDAGRSGRVIFIDGPRGAGKTSLMLTLLARWKKLPDRRVLLPVLDFDPLPRGMPLHGWLIEPWRKEAARLEREGIRGGSLNDLSEMFADVFERAVIGWMQATVEGKGVVEKAIAFQEQASGWIATRTIWHNFINAAVCRAHGCRDEHCEKTHPLIFVIAIDDVDLQVEQVPQLLHAIRLFHHSNVIYVLTGAYDHLRFALELDYIGRHSHRAHSHQHDKVLWKQTKDHSERLRDAFLEKVLPKHAKLTLETLSFKVILDMDVGHSLSSKTTSKKVGDVIDERWKTISAKAKDLRIATARRAQHAIDRIMGTTDGPKPNLSTEQSIEFVADLCGTKALYGTDLEGPDKQVRWQFALRGRITTRRGSLIQALEGDQLRILLTDQPVFAFLPDFNEAKVQFEDEAHRAFIIQLAVEDGLAEALALEWAPDAGVVTTEARWNSSSKDIIDTAVFYWPWFLRPKASEVLNFQEVGKAMRKAFDGISRNDLDEKMIATWLLTNIENSEELSPSVDENGPASFAKFEKILRAKLSSSPSEGGVNFKVEIPRWISELMVMTAPYFGLPDELAEQLRGTLIKLADKTELTFKKIQDEEQKKVKDAIIIGQQTSVMRTERKPLDGRDSSRFIAAVKEFLLRRKELGNQHSWWNWLDGQGKICEDSRAVVSHATPQKAPVGTSE